MATGPYDLGPFQTLSAVNFAQGGIFGWVTSVGLGVKIPTVAEPVSGFVTCLGLTTVPFTWTPLRTFPDEQATRTNWTIFVGSALADLPTNPFAPELSSSPGSTPQEGFDTLISKRITHVESGQSFIIDDFADAGKICDKGAAGDFYHVIYSTTGGATYTSPTTPFPTMFAAQEYWVITAFNVGTDTEAWLFQSWYNDTSNPAINTARFWDVAVADDKLTWT